ncbi:MAG: Na+:solute symporter [Bacteroidia bacterium]
MKLQWIDIAIILIYLAATVVIGLALRRRAQKSKSNYLLGGNNLPWYMLGLSNASGMFDISGTMWLVTLMFVYGLKSVWIPWLWPVFNQIFLMMYLSAWLRRSQATTGAEWLATRFGTGRATSLSHVIVVVFALISCLGFMAYGFIGLGKFMKIFIPWEVVSAYVPFAVNEAFVPHLYGIVFTFFAVFYSLLGGMLSVVWADVMQYTIMTVSSVMVAMLAMQAIPEAGLAVPAGWFDPWFGARLDIDWSSLHQEVMAKIESDGYSLFSLFFGMMVFKGILVSAAGPAPNYDMQKILATRSPREAALMSGSVSAILNPVRYLMITGFAVLAIVHYDKLDLLVAGQLDFEQILPSAINELVPVGLTGMLLAGLLAAFMSTFAGTLNAAQAYIINDVYLKYINPHPNPNRVSLVNYGSGLAIIAVSIFIGIFATDVNSVLQWLVSGLFGGYTAANVIKWYWWRFNGYGYFWGMLTGIIAALVFPEVLPPLFPQVPEVMILLYFFPLLLLVSVVGCIGGTLAYPPTDMATLKAFYRQVRPWGFWGPVAAAVRQDDPAFVANDNFRRDMVNVVVGVIWQTTLVATPVFLVLKQWGAGLAGLALIALASYFLKRNWYDRLDTQ